ncbi:hypothetical protein AB4Y96_04885 [Phyllobacterium sp. TAF24]|uniref:hypothetical protein n=1 Tax=Phyllobacterium sp. TAF24 TaxID=3233068 RepID=UPI003F9CB9EF
MALDLRRTEGRERAERLLPAVGDRAGANAATDVQSFEAALRSTKLFNERGKNANRKRTDKFSRVDTSAIGKLKGFHSEEMLLHILEHVLPVLELGPEIAAIAAELMQEEIDKCRDVNGRIAEVKSVELQRA